MKYRIKFDELGNGMVMAPNAIITHEKEIPVYHDFNEKNKIGSATLSRVEGNTFEADISFNDEETREKYQTLGVATSICFPLHPEPGKNLPGAHVTRIFFTYNSLMMPSKDDKCPNCGKKMFDVFTNSWHDIAECGKQKKAFNYSQEA